MKCGPFRCSASTGLVEVGWDSTLCGKPRTEGFARNHDPIGRLSMFCETEEEEKGTFCPLDMQGSQRPPEQWEKVTILVDSGATENVANPASMKGYQVLKNSASESGLTYTTATGKEIPNLGEKVVVVATTEGSTRSIKFQMCDVTKCLASVSRIVEAGHRVILDTPEAGSYIENRKSGERTYLLQERGLYLLDAWVMPFAEANHVHPFQGQGAHP